MERKTSLRIALALTTIGGALAVCRPKVNDGDKLTVANDTTCWQCPGGDNLSSFSRVYECANQRNRGTIILGSEVIVTANEFDFFSDKGFLRVTGSVLNPVTGVRSDTICWADKSDFKK